MKTIYNTYVVMESQEQCDRMKQLCIDNGLKVWEDEMSFEHSVEKYSNNSFGYGLECEFYVGHSVYDKEQITEQEFIELLKLSK